MFVLAAVRMWFVNGVSDSSRADLARARAVLQHVAGVEAALSVASPVVALSVVVVILADLSCWCGPWPVGVRSGSLGDVRWLTCTNSQTTGPGAILPHPLGTVGTLAFLGPLPALHIAPQVLAAPVITFPASLSAVVDHPAGVGVTLVACSPSLALGVPVHTLVWVDVEVVRV